MRDLVVPIAVVCTLASLLLPLPPAVLDTLLIINLLLSLLLLASSLYISEPLKLSALPSMLLLGTLFRLALNVSTTRMILNTAEAGQVIQAFGEVVIQGNLVVGTVVFLIITIIQFMVIAKGAERVAEVSARFTLDALPGKQMSIDADVRAGLIDFETARQKRQDLQTESRFYGALDGAMKFIKGDAIAGIVIVAINIVGGFIVGIAMHGLGIKAALSIYTLLTVGDGLVSQIPALLNALAAAIVVTRVSKGDGESLARELPHQLGQLRSVKLVVASLAMLLGLIPHMPLLPFGAVALLTFFSTFSGSKREEGQQDRTPEFQPRSPVALSIELSVDAGQALRKLGTFAQSIDTLRQRIFERHGLILGLPDVVPVPESSGFSIFVRGVQALQAPIPGTTQQLADAIVAGLEETITSRLSEFVDDILTRRSLDRLEREAPELVATVIPGVISVTQLTELLRGLISEGIPIRNFDVILQAIAERGAKAKNERVLLEDVRVALRRVITAQFQSSTGTIESLVLAPLYDAALHGAEREGRPLEESVLQRLSRDLRLSPVAEAVIVCSKGARKLLYELVLGLGVKRTILAYEEICDEGRILVQRGMVGSADGQREILEALAA